MPKKSIIILFGIALLISIVVPAYSVNLLQNPSFETWTSLRQPANWTVEDTTQAKIYKESTNVFHGIYSAKMQRLIAGSGSNKGLMQRLTIPGRGQFVARARFKENTDSVSGGITITWRRSDESFLSSWTTTYTVNSANWQVVQRIDTAATDAGVADFLIRTYGTSTTPAGGIVVVDSVFFERVTGNVEENRTTNNLIPFTLEVSPNPFSNFATINFAIEPSSFQCVKIYDATGNIVKTITKSNYTNNVFRTIWDGRNTSGQLVPDGVYFVALETNQNKTKVVKSLLLR
jgi:hypothetical protein